MIFKRVKGYQGLFREDLGAEGKRYRIVISRGGRRIQEYFYFGRNRPEPGARKEALRRWKEIRRSIPRMTRPVNAQIERRRSRTGIVGVRRTTDTVKGQDYDFWVAVWTNRKGTVSTRKYSVNKYGERRARKLAILARRRGVAGMDE